MGGMDKVDIELHGTVSIVDVKGWSIWPWRRGPQVFVKWQGERGAVITRPLRVGDEMRVTLTAYLLNQIDWKVVRWE